MLRFGFYHEAHDGATFSNATAALLPLFFFFFSQDLTCKFTLATNRQTNQTTATKSSTMPPKGGGKKEPEKKVEKKVEKKEGERQL